MTGINQSKANKILIGANVYEYYLRQSCVRHVRVCCFLTFSSADEVACPILYFYINVDGGEDEGWVGMETNGDR